MAFCVPPVRVESKARPFVVPIFAVTAPSTVREPPLSVTGIAVWLLAITTGEEAAIAACPAAKVLVLIAERVVSVAAPVGRGRDAAETGTVLLGLIATTSAESTANAAVEAALTVALFVPSVIMER
jgi:hypothetical protein